MRETLNVATLWDGTVSVVFTDIEGSTALTRSLGDSYGDVLAAHRTILRAAFEAEHGIEVDTQGDAFFFAFRRAYDAVRAAVDAQRALLEHHWPDGATVRVRMAVHTTEPAIAHEGYVGVGLTLGARLCAAGHGGQILLSPTTAGLVAEHDIPGVAVREVGEHHFKGIAHPQRIFEVVADGLPGNHPPLRLADAPPRVATLTVLFADMDGATRLLRDVGRSQFRSILETYYDVLREAIEADGGRFVDAAGDHVFAVFDLPSGAVAATRRARELADAAPWPANVAPKISFTLDSGELERVGGRYVGLAIHRCWALAKATHAAAGTVLSEATVSLLRDEHAIDLELRDIGDVEVGTFDRPVRAYELANSS